MLSALDDWAKLGRHPELSRVPLIARGSSNAGVTAYGLACYAPERMICSTPNVGPAYVPPTPPDEAMKVPALMHVGPRDPFFKEGVQDTGALFALARPKGALWAWDAEQDKGHEIRHIDDVDLKFYETCLALRLPPDADFRKGPVKLREIREEDGWLVDPSTWDSPLTRAAPYAEYKGDRAKALWVPSADIAYLYRAIATYNNPLKLAVRGLESVENPNASGSLLRSIGGSVVDPGRQLVIECDVTGLPDWQKIEFYDGARKIGQADRGGKPQCRLTVDGNQTVYALSVLGYDAKGAARTSYPVHFVVRDPKLSAELTRQRENLWAPPPPRTLPWGAVADRPRELPKADPDDAVLVAYGLTEEQERTFTDTFYRPFHAQFWTEYAERHDTARINARHWSSTATTQPAHLGTARVLAHAAYSRRGLYLLFIVTDSKAKDGSPMRGSMDFHIARDSSKEIWSGKTLNDRFLAIQYSLALSAAQYQAGIGVSDRERPAVSRNIPSPWDMRRVEMSANEVETREGIIVRSSHLSADMRAMEWFIPWDRVGHGGAFDQPKVGMHLGLVLGYNDTTRPADGKEQTVNLRWPNGGDPWQYPAEKGPADSPWGDLEIGPMLGNQ